MSVPAIAAPSEVAPPQGVDAPSTGPAGAIPAGEQRADPTQVSRAETQEQDTRPPDYVRDAFARLRGYTQNAAPASDAKPEAVASQPAPQAPPASSRPAQEPGRSAFPSTQPASTFPAAPAQARPQAPASRSQTATEVITLTPEEYQRRVQSEADRILSRRQKEDQDKAAREREVELRRTDPFAYARLIEEKEQELTNSRQETERLTTVVGTQLQYFDRAVLDTFVGALPEDERPRVVSRHQDAIENRKETATNTLKALRARWTAEGQASAKATLMKDQTFIKEILARYGQAGPEPESVQTATRSASDAAPQDGETAMNSWIRGAAQQARAVSR